MISADDTSKQSVKVGVVFGKVNPHEKQASFRHLNSSHSKREMTRSCLLMQLRLAFLKGLCVYRASFAILLPREQITKVLIKLRR